MKFLYLSIFPKSVKKIHGWLKSDKNNKYFMEIAMYIDNDIKLHSFSTEECFRQKL